MRTEPNMGNNAIMRAHAAHIEAHREHDQAHADAAVEHYGTLPADYAPAAATTATEDRGEAS